MGEAPGTPGSNSKTFAVTDPGAGFSSFEPALRPASAAAYPSRPRSLGKRETSTEWSSVQRRPVNPSRISASVLTACTFPLALSQIQRRAGPSFGSPLRSARNASSFPSGDHDGDQLCPVEPVMFWRSPLARSVTQTSAATPYHATPVRVSTLSSIASRRRALSVTT
jgi:hypothetical protein